MELKELGGSGEKIPAIGIGTWKMGVDRKAEVAALGAGIAAGSRFVDTAEIYGTEHIVAEALRGKSGVFVATKVWPNHLHYDDVIKACDRSLAQLGVKSIDLYQIHWPNYKVPIEETMAAMEKLVDDGKIRHIGVSNFSAKEMQEARAAMKRYDIVSNQVEFSILVRDAEKSLCMSAKGSA